MKKRVVSLLLILLLCLGLWACGTSLDKQQLAAVCGTWYLRPYHEKDNAPGYFELKQDGTGSVNGKEALTWSAGLSGEAGGLPPVSVKLESGARFALAFHADDSGCVEALLTDEAGGSAGYFKASTQIRNPWFGELQTRWYGSDSPVQTVELKGDGTVILDKRCCFWSNAAEWEYNENYIQLNLYDERGVFGYISAEAGDNGLYELRVRDNSTGEGYSCYSHPLLPVLAKGGTWVSVDRYTMIAEQFMLDPRQAAAAIGEEAYTLSFDTEDKAELTVGFLAGDAACYEARVFLDGELPMAMLTDLLTGRQTLYYNDSRGYDRANPAVRYDQTLNMIYSYVNGQGIYDLDTGTYIEPEERLAYIHGCLTALGDYGQARELLDRFTVVPHKLTAVTENWTDGQGAGAETVLSWYEYDKNGVLIRGCGEDIVEKYGVFADTTQNLIYNSRGNIAKIEVGTNAVYAVGQPIFDTVGKLIGMTVHRQGERDTSVYTYNADRQPIRLKIPTADYGDERIYEYTYDDAGRLITKVRTTGEGRYVITTDYLYEGDVLAEVHQTRTDWGSGYHWNYTLTSDEQGRPLSAAVETNDPDYAGKTVEILFVYEDLYFFDDTGLEPGKD